MRDARVVIEGTLDEPKFVKSELGNNVAPALQRRGTPTILVREDNVILTTFVTQLVYETTSVLPPKRPQAAVTTVDVSQPTVIVNLPPPPKPKKSGISEKTEHALIATGSIGLTILVAVLAFMIYRMQKGMALKDALKFNKKTPQKELDVSAPLGRNWGMRGFSWDRKNNWNYENSNLPARTLPRLPRKALVRTDTSSSNRPLLSAPQNPSPSPRPSPRPSAGREQPMNFFDDDNSTSSQSRATRSSLALPKQQPLPDPKEQNAFLHDDSQSDSTASSAPDYLRNAMGRGTPPKLSRFSWTNSQATPTPRDPRFSIATSTTSSVPRYRTVESWVGQQTNNVQERQIKELLDMMPPEPQEVRNTTPMPYQQEEQQFQHPPASRPRHEQQDVPQTGYIWEAEYRPRRKPVLSQASVFNVHPGEQMKLPRGSRIPSEILDKNFVLNVI
ncbi:hypothetical protein K402DRAFT_407660 [Aulographum hederae CBS 113979]|uniref:Uncharacterized protein n=1 Tax=Aulographum hederae CBS 113979 TaxID=1176131 RepID=A0A6G1GNI4_9PEZI|nr:hypothetical protein K402DRAFT_407660 [Aulographum hederae CBS 113979]